MYAPDVGADREPFVIDHSLIERATTVVPVLRTSSARTRSCGRSPTTVARRRPAAGAVQSSDRHRRRQTASRSSSAASANGRPSAPPNGSGDGTDIGAVELPADEGGAARSRTVAARRDERQARGPTARSSTARRDGRHLRPRRQRHVSASGADDCSPATPARTTSRADGETG